MVTKSGNSTTMEYWRSREAFAPKSIYRPTLDRRDFVVPPSRTVILTRLAAKDHIPAKGAMARPTTEATEAAFCVGYILSTRLRMHQFDLCTKFMTFCDRHLV